MREPYTSFYHVSLIHNSSFEPYSERRREMRRVFFCFVLLVLLVPSSDASAQTARCKGKIIKEGLSKQFVISNCGQPDHMESYSLVASSGSIVGETLFYYQGRRAYIFEIRRGKVSKITRERR
jgi:hypothetical protein